MSEMTVECSVWVEADRERAWKAVTDAKELSQWYSPGSPWDIPKLEVGEPIFFHHTPNEYHSGSEVVTLRAIITEVEERSAFSVRWEFDGVESDMVTSFLLEEENGGTRVTMKETGYEDEAAAKQTEEGYTMSLANLYAFLSGNELPY
ncbi:SRPBCC domain-containing protein [Paenibacillus sp. LHD-117]|uniref:SRPBCC domain-containing protein n=1 Tax=Paenibacillus sp. LHD-117 TaxID=3071412 RepID=UPI0027E18BFC|nr:SRPBCC domain-containing protein [Paenibacillus sp. LHD-117]MDQ6419446.1 SRPBCC domain-containing protein [Paenibacillus sp. LHD-117]